MKTYVDKEKLKKCKVWLIENDLSIRGLSRKLSISEQCLHDYIRGRMASKRLDRVFGLTDYAKDSD